MDDPKKKDKPQVLTPLPNSGGEYSVIPTMRPGDAAQPKPTPGSIFAGGVSSNNQSTPFRPSLPPENLDDDKLILSAPRMNFDGRPTPMLGGIHILAKLGQGGMGAVYYGVHPRLNQEVAVKVLPFHLAERQPELVQRFIREAQIAARVRSPHLVGVIDVNEQNGLFYLVMEYVPGLTAGGYLRQLAARGQTGMLEEEALDICLGALIGLAAAHAHGVIHRDIKPENIIVPFAPAGRIADPSFNPPTLGGPTFSSEPANPSTITQTPSDPRPLDFTAAKLLDLGLARHEEGSMTMTGVNACMGTPGYMSPEQAQDARHASKPADVFSMGATLYALITGDAPFRGTALMHVLNATVKEPHVPIRRIRPDVSKDTAELLERCLKKVADARYADANALLTAMRACRAAIEGRPKPEPLKPYTPLPHEEPAGALTLYSRESDIQEAIKSATASQRAAAATAQPPTRSHALGIAVGLLAAALVILGVGGYFAWTILHRDPAAEREKELVAQRALEATQQAQQKVQREKEAADAQAREKAQREADAQKQLDTQRKEQEAREAAQIQAAELKKRQDAEQARLAAEKAADELKRRQEIEQRDQRRKDQLVLDSFTAAVKVAADYKRDKNWDGVLIALDDPMRALAARPHPNRELANTLIAEAKSNLERQRQFKTERERASTQLKAQSYEAARNTFEAARKFAQEPAELKAVEDGLKIADEGLRQNKFIQAAALERQGRALKADTNPKGDWAKAADSFKAASEIYLQADRKDDLARVVVQHADCWRKDKNPSGDWSKAAALYASAGQVFAALGDKKNQAEALAHEAQCWDPAANPAGTPRQVAMLYGRAAQLHGELGNKKQQADYLSLQGATLFKAKALPKNFEQAEEVFRRAAALYGDSGEKKAQAVCLLNQALSLAKGEKKNVNAQSRDLLQQSATLSREAGDEAGAKLVESWMK